MRLFVFIGILVCAQIKPLDATPRHKTLHLERTKSSSHTKQKRTTISSTITRRETLEATPLQSIFSTARKKLAERRISKGNSGANRQTPGRLHDDVFDEAIELARELHTARTNQKRVDIPAKKVRFILTNTRQLLLDDSYSFSQERKLTEFLDFLALLLLEQNPPPKMVKAAEQFQRWAKDTQYRRRLPNHATAVEIEFVPSNSAIEKLTTLDGTLRPLLRYLSPTRDSNIKEPAFLRNIPRKQKYSTRWDSLSTEEKRQFLIYIVKRNGTTMGRPKIRGLVLRFAKDRLGSEIDLGGPLENGKLNILEFQRRSKGLASTNLREAFNEGKKVGFDRPQAHIHIPYLIPLLVRKGFPAARMAMVDWYRRVNTFIELVALKDDYSLAKVSDEELIHFDSLENDDLIRYHQYLWSVSQDGAEYATIPHNALKFGYVGIRGHEAYDGTVHYGLEIRHLPKNPRLRDLFVNAVQRGVLSAEYGVPLSIYQRLQIATEIQYPDVETNSKEHQAIQGLTLSTLHYNAPIEHVLENTPQVLLNTLKGKARSILRDHADKNFGIKMLVHDWSRDFQVIKTEKQRSKIIMSQLDTLRKMKSGMDPDAAIKHFVLSSGLIPLYGKSIGIPNLK